MENKKVTELSRFGNLETGARVGSHRPQDDLGKQLTIFFKVSLQGIGLPKLLTAKLNQ